MSQTVDIQLVLTFDGLDDYIDFGKNDIGGVFAEGSSVFTVSGWINPYQLTNKATTYGTRNVFFARSSDRYSDNFEFGISEEGNLDIYIDETFTKSIKTFGNRELTIEQWHFFAIVFNAGQLSVYIDEHEYTGSFTGSSLNKATSHVTLGATLHNKIYFTGQLANISVWNYACTQTEIQSHRSGLIVGNEAGLVAYWKLNEGQGTTISNQTGDDYQGTLRGNPNWDVGQIPFAAQSSNELETQLETTISAREQIEQNEVSINIQQVETQTLVPEESSENMEPTSKPKYKILAIDGGGIRGIIPALILAEIEKRAQKPIFSLFDLIAGSSSGGILALGLTKPRLTSDLSENLSAAEYTAEDLLQIFVEYGAEIFYEPFFEKILGPLEDIFLQPKYPSQGRESILRQYFGDTTLESSLKEVFVTSYDIEQRIPIFFTNKLEKQQLESKYFRKLCAGFTLTDAALATSATPTYFAPHRISSSHDTNSFYTLIDGGIVANNPANLAIVEAQISSKKQTKQALNLEDILVVSLGTGSLTSIYPYDEVKKWGLLQWTRPLLNIVFDGGSEAVAGELERLFEPINNETKSYYYRFQTFLSSELEEIDNIKLENIRQLKDLANRLIAEKSQQLDELCSLLLG